MSLEKKNIFITGGTTGIGLELAKLYAKKGHRVGVCGRDLNKLSQEDKDLFDSYQADVGDVESLHNAMNEFAQEKLDIVIANAGISMGKKLSRPNFERAKTIIDVNVIGVLNTFEKAYDLMETKGEGQLVAIGSVAGYIGLPGAGPYSASKAAIIKLCESLRIDLKKQNIAVTTICPGFIDTPLTRQNDHAMPFLMSAEKGALKIAEAIDAKKALYVFPWQMHIAVQILARMPRFLYRYIIGLRSSNYSSTDKRS